MTILTENQKDFIGSTFTTPKDGVLTVVDFIGKQKNGVSKFSVECSICSKDKELFPNLFESNKGNLIRGRSPCGCSKNPKWSFEQYLVIINRRCKDIGYTFIDFCGDFKGDKTKILLHNPSTGNTWDTTTVTNFVRNCHGDPSMRVIRAKEVNSKPDSEHIKDFIASGAFSAGTIFERNLEKKDKSGCLSYWNVYCDRCDTYYTNGRGHLKGGKLSCLCSSGGGFNRNKPATLYLYRWYGFGQSFLKFGITNLDVLTRIKDQFRKGKLDYEEVYTYSNDDGNIIADCELFLKQKLTTCVCPKEWLPDGYTETTYDDDKALTYIKEYIKNLRLNN